MRRGVSQSRTVFLRSPPEGRGVTGAPGQLASTGNGSDHRTKPMLVGTSKPPKTVGFWEKPPKNTPTPKVSANLWLLWRMWQMWRSDSVVFKIPPEPQVQMKLGLCGFSGYAGIFWPLGGVGQDSAQLSPPVLTLSGRLRTIVIMRAQYVWKCTCHCRSWNPKIQLMLSMIVIMVTGPGDTVIYRPGRSKECARIPPSCGGLTCGRRSDCSPCTA